MQIETGRLTLEPWSPVHLRALVEEPATFHQLSGIEAAAGLRQLFVSGDASPEWLASLATAIEPDPWQFGFRVTHRADRIIIGTCGYKLEPCGPRTIEIAYGISSTHERQGYATEVAAALTKYAFESDAFDLVIAHTLAAPNASTRVLGKCGFRKTEEIMDPIDGLIWRWELARPQ